MKLVQYDSDSDQSDDTPVQGKSALQSNTVADKQISNNPAVEPRDSPAGTNQDSFRSSPASKFDVDNSAQTQEFVDPFDLEYQNFTMEIQEELNKNEDPDTNAFKVKHILQKQEVLEHHKIPTVTEECPDELLNKIILWTDLREKGMYFNGRLRNTHAFRNPLIMNKMIQFMELDQYGTEFKKDVFDPKALLKLPSYKELMERRGPEKKKNDLYANFRPAQGTSKKSKPAPQKFQKRRI
ncbi:hypothetical protein HDV06_003274 [Boothiomyces sp. JEL0866]|nr:hypothetical protein HDV06_003274 [Boothiomyces sp. JEL0866]